MGNVKIKKKAQIEAEKLEQEQRKKEKEQFKNKKFTALSSKEKDSLLEILAKEHGLI